jgi:two-component system, OmpR family, phosphate regulon sensor histidine kinase PhoR
LVENLLKLSSLESTDNLPEKQSIDMPKLLARLLADAQALSNGRQNISLEMLSDAALNGSEAEIFSAFTNLVTNAIRYTPDGGNIVLRWHAAPQENIFEVVDSGIGIDAEHIPRLTERFYRVDRGRSRQTGGTGLGLAIVKHVAQRHGALLEIISERGNGSTFRLIFPHPNTTM